ncbi:hypothetical protein [uncultured Roseobacter sp.]|uniref:hypothetical protein n=1 Tax=uncultured Roseobacter sp. TaxID=114847 RepID=UPI002633E034|nr:hypothetical protein [uncultured Roseobacter sp.]
MPFDQFDEYGRLNAHFTTDEVVGNIKKISEETYKRMLANTTRIGPRGETLEGDEWLDVTKLESPLIHPQGWQARYELLNAKIYGHACPMFVKELFRAEVVTLDDPKQLSGKEWPKLVTFLRTGETKSRIKQLATRSWGDVPMNLGEFAAMGDSGPDTAAGQSHNKLLRMARLGLALVSPYETKNGGYNITAGPVAISLYEGLYLSLSDEFESKIPGKYFETEEGDD